MSKKTITVGDLLNRITQLEARITSLSANPFGGGATVYDSIQESLEEAMQQLQNTPKYVYMSRQMFARLLDELEPSLFKAQGQDAERAKRKMLNEGQMRMAFGNLPMSVRVAPGIQGIAICDRKINPSSFGMEKIN